MDDKIEEAVCSLKNDGVVIFPTETVYGIGARVFSEEAVKRIYDAKKRPENKPISLLVSNIEMVEQIADNISDIEYKIIKEFFPGPLTIILKKNEKISDVVTAGLDTVGVRMPAGMIARKIVEGVGEPIATSSANISGSESGTSINNIDEELLQSADYVINNGKSEIGIASTIVQVVNGKIKILREGSISKEEIINKINA